MQIFIFLTIDDVRYAVCGVRHAAIKDVFAVKGPENKKGKKLPAICPYPSVPPCGISLRLIS